MNSLVFLALGPSVFAKAERRDRYTSRAKLTDLLPLYHEISSPKVKELANLLIQEYITYLKAGNILRA